jgi:hypothetical protein
VGGVILKIKGERFLVLGIGMVNPLHLTTLHVAKQVWGDQDASGGADPDPARADSRNPPEP